MSEDQKRSVATSRRSALHEAGHALMAYLCNRPLELVTIVPEGKRGGRTSYASREGDGRKREPTEELIKIALAAGAGEMVVTRSRSWNLVGTYDDCQRAHELARTFLPEDKVVAYLRDVKDSLTQLLKQPAYTAVLKDLAMVLLQKETLDGQEAERIIGDVLRAYGEAPGETDAV